MDYIHVIMVIEKMTAVELKPSSHPYFKDRQRLLSLN